MDMTEDATLVDDASADSPGSVQGAGSASAAARKSRVSLACQRCKRRKQRCNGEHPECASCRKAQVECLYERALRPRYPGGKSLYISALEERIAFLEEKMPVYGQDHLVSSTQANYGNRTGALSASRQPSVRRRPSRAVTDSTSDADEDKSSLVDGVAYLSLCASGTTDTAPEPFYVGSSSGATIARLIQSSIFSTSKSRTAGPSSLSPGPDVLRPGLSEVDERMSGIAASVNGTKGLDTEFPYPPQAQTLFAVFFDRLHTRWPILDRRMFASIFEQQWNQGALSIVQRSLLHLIYAITARFLQLMKKNCDVDAAQHFAAAIEPMDYILEQHNLATVQFLALLAIYGQRSPYGAGSWTQIRYAITLCIELGLHRRQTAHQHHNHADVEVRNRVFWACYCLDRMTTVALGRTFSIADRDINVELPSDRPELWHLTASNPEDWSNIRPFVHIIKLRKLQSKVFRTVWRVDKDILSSAPAEKAKLDMKIDNVRRELDEWHGAIPVAPKDVKGATWMYDPESACHEPMNYFNLQYHKTVLSLYTALLPTLPPSDPRFLSATRSAAAICTIYKSLNAQKTLSYTIVALHSCFIAGLTLVYCLWTEPALFDYNALEATRACSLCLTIFGEKWPGAVKYRDIFDAMSGSLLKSIVGGGQKQRSSSNPNGGRAPLDIDTHLPRHDPMPAIPEVAPNHSANTVADAAASESSGNVLFGAVKDAFMNVDEEAAGGWQGWRMFNEMVQSDIATAPRSMGMGSDGQGAAGQWGLFAGQEYSMTGTMPDAWGWSPYGP